MGGERLSLSMIDHGHLSCVQSIYKAGSSHCPGREARWVGESVRMSHFPGFFYPAVFMTRLGKHQRAPWTPVSPHGLWRSLPGNVSFMSSCLKTSRASARL